MSKHNPMGLIITFEKPEQAAIFDIELTGQFSDGHWENDRGWEEWCEAEVRVDPDPEEAGTSWYPGRQYGVTSKALRDVVGFRMKVYGYLARCGYTIEQVELIDSLFLSLDGTFREGQLAKDKESDYRKGQRAEWYRLARQDPDAFSEDAIRQHVRDVSEGAYTDSDLFQALKAIRATMRRFSPALKRRQDEAMERDIRRRASPSAKLYEAIDRARAIKAEVAEAEDRWGALYNEAL